jgi:hypothetical protein
MSGCDVGRDASPYAGEAPSTNETVAQTSDAADAINTGAFTTVYAYAAEDTDSSWDKNSATSVVFDGKTATISGSGAEFVDYTLTIKQPGTYALSGTLSNGQVFIDAGKDDIVRLVLNGVSLHNETGPAVYAAQSEKVILILEAGTDNRISDGGGYAEADDTDTPDAAVFAQDNLSITGNGALTVIGGHNHGVRAQDDLVITGGTLSVEAVGDALRGRDGVAIQSGSLTLKAEGDGIQSNNTEDDAKGFVTISGGTFTIEARNDGIQAQSALTVTGGEFHIKTGGGSANAPVREEDFRGGGFGGRGERGGNAPIQAETEEETVSMKALKAGKLLRIAGGEFYIDAEDDAVHANGDIDITSGVLSIQSGDDALHADAALNIEDGSIHIPVCYEGLEGLSVTITGGEIAVIASDDAINAAGGADNASQFGGPMGADSFATSGERFVRVSGGMLDLSAARDGIDSNGDIFLAGGVVKISGPSQGMEGAIDLDGNLLVTGGEMITAGSVINPSADSTQAVLLVSYSAQQAVGSVIAVKDANGNTLLEYTAKNAYTASGFSSPSLRVGETVALFIDGEKRTDIQLSGVITNVADDGGAYSGGFGGGRGNRGGGMPPG